MAGPLDVLKLRKPVHMQVGGISKLASNASKIGKTTFEMAHELAQKRAALPTAKGGLGLPKNNTSEQRANAMGFNRDTYHGTFKDIKKLDPRLGSTESHAGKGVYSTDSPLDASRNYASIYGPDVSVRVERGMEQLDKDWRSIHGRMKDEALTPLQKEIILRNTMGADNSGVVYPLKVRSEKSIHLDNPEANELRVGPFEHYDELTDTYTDTPNSAKFNEALDEFRELGGDANPIYEAVQDYGEAIPARELFRVIKKEGDSGGLYDPHSGDIVSGGVAAGNFMKHFGVDEIRHTPQFNNNELNIGKEHTISLNPDNVRSRFAAFDPFRIDAAIAAAMGVAAPDLLAAEPDKKAVGGLAGSLIRKASEVASKAKPFYSAVDEAISSLPNKALGDQFIKELLKRGAKPQEIIDRNLDNILGAPIVQKTRTVNLKKPDKKGRTQIEEKYFEVTPSEKGSKSIGRVDVEKAATDNPPPQIFETTLRGPEEGNKYRAEYDPDSQRWEVMDDYSMPVARFVDEEDAIERAAKLNDSGTAKFADTEYVTKGGTNHREILFRMPSDVPEKESALRSWHEQMKQKYKTIGWKELATTEEVSKNNALVAALKKDQNAFKSQHYDEPNILAHARVSDRIGPNGEKILHVDEIQSDLHQKARDARKKEIKRLVKNGMTEEDAKKAVPSDFGYSGNIKELPEGYKLEEFISPSGARAYRVNDPQGTLYSSGMSPESATKNAIENLNVGVPDAPFKSDWHELVMKRLLDDAARNGYDRVTITPGAEQAKRYGLSKQVGELVHWKDGDQIGLSAVTPENKEIFSQIYFKDSELDSVVGKELAEKIRRGEGETNSEFGFDLSNGEKALRGAGLQFGGEGMIGFYDQMLPAFVNKYGAKTGLRMNLGDTPVDGKKYKVYQDSNPMPWSIVPEDGFTIAGRYATQEEADRAALAMGTQPHHSIDITPEFRESVMEKGQPFYQIGAGSAIGAAAASQEEPKQSSNIATFRKGGEVNLDAMRMAVTNKQLRKRHG